MKTLTIPVKVGALAYSYIRFSHPRQEWGASEIRQEEGAKDYCERHGLTLAEIYADRGKSAWKGKHRNGALGRLVTILKPGDWLLVEDEDRLSREDPLTAMNFLREIVARGVTIVTLRDGKTITKNNFFDLSILFSLFLKAALSNQENNKKSDRLLDAWERRRQTILKGKDAFGKLPFWLKRDKFTEQIEIIPEAAKVVKRIFKMELEGHGVRFICDQFNKEKIPTFIKTRKGREQWHASKVQNVLKNPAVYGAFQNYKKDETGKKQPIGELTENVLPAIVTKEEFLIVKDKTAQRGKFKGRYTPNKINNLFTGFVVCAHCGGSMIYTKKGNWGYLTCGEFHFNHNCKKGVLNYKVVEQTIFKFILSRVSLIHEIKRVLLFDEFKRTEVSQIDAKRAELNEIRNRIKILMDSVFGSAAPKVVIAKIAELEKQETEIQKVIENLEAEQRRASQVPEEFIDVAKHLADGAKLPRIQLRDKMRTMIKKMTVDVSTNSFSVTWFKDRTDRFEVKRQFRGAKPAIWFWRRLLGQEGSEWSDWVQL